MKCTQKLPNKRYMSCEELLQDLKHSLVDPEGDFVVLDGVRYLFPLYGCKTDVDDDAARRKEEMEAL